MLFRSVSLLIAAAVLVVAGSAAWAQDAPCDVEPVDRFRFLRQLSLDLRGRVPTEAELRALVDAPDVEPSDIDEMLDGADFRELVRQHHRDLLWPAAEALDVVNAAAALLLPAAFYEYDGDGDPERLFLLFTGFYVRGGLVPCKDEPAEWDEDGNLVFEDFPDGTRREGYVLMETYWSPDRPLKVCALEARTGAGQVPDGGDYSGVDCRTFTAMILGQCGCGPQLQNCAGIPVVLDVVASMQEQQLRLIEGPILAGRPYHEGLTTGVEEVNGPLAHYYRHLTPMAVDPLVLVPPVDPAELPDIPYTETEWHPVARLAPVHSGVLTSMAYLLRFQTGRARANQFYNSFLCQPFIAPPDGLPSPNDACSDEPNLRERCGCSDCHIQLEPAAAHWGRFADAGTLYIDPAQYPTYLARCAACAERGGEGCDFVCSRLYVSEIGHEKERPYAGVQRAYQWRGPDEVARLEGGPRLLVQDAVSDGRLASCAARKLFTRLYRRDPTQRELLVEIPRFARAFADSDYNFRTLVKTMVTDPAYRRMSR